MGNVSSFKDLKVWKKVRDLVKDIYILTQNWPSEERYGLTGQIRRAAISVSSNIAEGSAKRSTKEFLRFLSIAYGSLAEMESQIILAEDLGYASHEATQELFSSIHESGRMLNGLMRSLEAKTSEKILTTEL